MAAKKKKAKTHKIPTPVLRKRHTHLGRLIKSELRNAAKSKKKSQVLKRRQAVVAKMIANRKRG